MVILSMGKSRIGDRKPLYDTAQVQLDFEYDGENEVSGYFGQPISNVSLAQTLSTLPSIKTALE